MQFKNRSEAGKALASQLMKYSNAPDTVVLGLPRGGVPVAYELAMALHLPLNVFVVRKLGFPGQPEFAMGAIASGGARVLDESVVKHVNPRLVQEEIDRQLLELKRREQMYQTGALQVEGKTVILVDDGLATGATMLVAVRALRSQDPRRIVVAVPVSAAETCDEFKLLVDEIVCLYTPRHFLAVGLWYEDFSQTTDDEVKDLLSRAARRSSAA